MQIIWQPLINLLFVFYHLFFNNLGLAIIFFTIFIRLLMIPLWAPQLRMTQKMNKLKPELDRIKNKHKGDRVKLAQAQGDFYKKHGVNPASGCLPMIIPMVILFALFQGFTSVLSTNGDALQKANKILYPPLQLTTSLNTQFLGIDLTRPDRHSFPGIPLPLPGAVLVFAAISQFLSSKMMYPYVQKEQKIAHKTPQKSDDLMVGMQKQSLYLFPIMTLVFGLSFASGLALYWGILSLVQMIQQYFISGWGGLTPWVLRLNLVKSGSNGKERR